MNYIKSMYKRGFCVLSIDECKRLGLQFKRNLYGDEINHLNCRSIWEDGQGRIYRCKQLFT